MFMIKAFRGCITLLGILILIQTILRIQSRNTDNDTTCLPSTFRRIEIYDKLMAGFDNTTMVTSVESCAELCGGSNVCQSFGFNTLNNTCYMYVNRVKLSLKSTNEVGMVYYWLLQDSCPTSYQNNSELSLCYRMFPADPNVIKTVADAEEKCEQDGGHLIIIDTEERRKFLVEFLSASDNKHVVSLVGGMELGTGTEDWHWYNGAKVTHWFFNQPDDYQRIEDCLQAICTSTSVEFNDVPCVISQSYICEIPMV